MKTILILVGIFSTFVASAAAAESSTTAEVPQALQVEILVFSGRPDPKFIITEATIIKEITDVVKSLPVHPSLKGDSNLTRPGLLGYRGIRVYNVSDINSDVEWFTIYRSAVEVLKKGVNEKDFKLDASTALEGRLIQMAEDKKLMPDVVLAHIKNIR